MSYFIASKEKQRTKIHEIYVKLSTLPRVGLQWHLDYGLQHPESFARGIKDVALHAVSGQDVTLHSDTLSLPLLMSP